MAKRFLKVLYSGVGTQKIDKGRIFGGDKGYLEGIFGNPSLVNNPRKNLTEN